jgi:hypothetical protein
MNSQCRFLGVSRHGPACSIGANFYVPGEDRELCRHCRVRALDDSAHCVHLEFSAIFVAKTGEDETVEAAIGCALSGFGLGDLSARLALPLNPCRLRVERPSKGTVRRPAFRLVIRNARTRHYYDFTQGG